MVTFNKKRLLGNLALLLTAFIWGSACVAQDVCAEALPPFTCGAIRYLIGPTALLPVLFIYYKITKKKNPERIRTKGDLKMLFTGGVLCGCALFCATSVQQIGFGYTTAGKAGFITALYVIIVPVLGLFIKKKPTPMVWFCVFLSVVGLFLLCVPFNEEFSINIGDLLVFLCAVIFAVHIYIIDRYTASVNPLAMAIIQFYVVAVLSIISAIIFENPFTYDIAESVKDNIFPLLYLGLGSTGIAYTLQVVMQKYTEPTTASIMMSFESVFAVFSAWIVLGQTMTAKEIFGCFLMFVSIILAQLPIAVSFDERKIKFSLR